MVWQSPNDQPVSNPQTHEKRDGNVTQFTGPFQLIHVSMVTQTKISIYVIRAENGQTLLYENYIYNLRKLEQSC